MTSSRFIVIIIIIKVRGRGCRHIASEICFHYIQILVQKWNSQTPRKAISSENVSVSVSACNGTIIS